MRLADLRQMFQRALSVAGEGRAIQHRDHDPRRRDWSAAAWAAESRLIRKDGGIGVARRQRRIAKRLFHFLSAHARVDASRIRTAGAPDFDDAAVGLQPMARRRGRGARGLARRLLGTGAENKSEDTLLGMERGSRGQGQQQGYFPDMRGSAHRVYYAPS